MHGKLYVTYRITQFFELEQSLTACSAACLTDLSQLAPAGPLSAHSSMASSMATIWMGGSAGDLSFPGQTVM